MNKTYIISDVHGNFEGLVRALEQHKIIDKHGNRQLAKRHQVVSIGDLANCVRDSLAGDLACLGLALGGIIDTLVIGNHEMPYFDPGNQFGGFHGHLEIERSLEELNNTGQIVPAMVRGGHLITHAGFSQHFLRGKADPNNDLNYLMSSLYDEWKNENYGHSIFRSIGYARGGPDPVGGVVWCDFDDEFMPTNFPQICGHTPRGLRFKGNALCIDVGAKNGDTQPLILEIK